MTTRSAPEIEAWLLSHLQARLGQDTERIEPHLPFSYYGLDSLDAVALATELEEWLGAPVSPDVAWDYPTPRALASYLGGASGEPEPADPDEALAALLAEFQEDD